MLRAFLSPRFDHCLTMWTHARSVLRDARRDYSGDAAGRLQNKYISDFDDATGTTTHVRTLNVYDRDFFRAEIQDEPKDPPVRPKPS